MPASIRTTFAPALFAALLAVAPSSPVRGQSPAHGFDLQRIGDGVYAAIRREPLGYAVHSNTVFIVGDSDVIVIDTDFTREAAREVLAALRAITPKPVRYVINTHWHDDHVMGNQVYRDAFPHAEFIAQTNTRQSLMTDAVTNRTQQLEGGPQAIAQLRDAIEKKQSLAGGPMADDERAALESNIAIFQQYLDESKDAEVVLPTRTFDDSLLLRRGKQTVKLVYLGRANTRGDAVIFIPAQRIVITGDLVVWPVPFTFGSYPGDWIAALGKVQRLRATTIVPGHGPVMHDDSYVQLLVRLLTSVRAQAAAAVTRGETLEEARKSITLDDFRRQFAGESKARSVFFSSFVVYPAVTRAWEEASGKP